MKPLLVEPRSSGRNLARGILAAWVSTCLLAAGVVATPTFAPTEGDSTGRFNVVVTCATPGAAIHYTLTGAEPTVHDRSIASGGSILIDRSMTLKAKGFNGAESSTTASGIFRVTGDIVAGGQSLMALKSDGKLYGWGYQDHGRLANGSTATSGLATPTPSKSSDSGNPDIVDATKASAGYRHIVVLDSLGKVWASGNNTLAECGRSGGGEFTYAVQVRKSATLTDYLTDCDSVAAGIDFSAAVESSGQVRTWGSQVSGRLGNGVHHASNLQTYAGLVKKTSSTFLTGIAEVALGKDFGIAREAHSSESPGGTGKVWVWGESSSGSLAMGSVSDQLYAAEAKASATVGDYLTDALEVDAGEAHSVVLRWKDSTLDMDGTVWTMGSRADGRIGDNGLTSGTQTYPVKVRETGGAVLNDIVQISAGAAHTLALDKFGNVWAWGNNGYGELGDNTTTDRAGAVVVKNPSNSGPLSNIVRVSAGGYLVSGTLVLGFSSAVAEDGTIYVWGNNKTGVMGNGVVGDTITMLPTPVSSLKTQPGFPTITFDALVTAANAPGTASLAATVADPDLGGTIQEVRFYLNGALHTTRTSAPWTATATSLAEGDYHCYAVVKDNTGLETTSLPDTFTILPTLDSDLDGLVDSWEITHFGDLAQNGSGDPDGDSVTNAAEAAVGTDPNSNPDANSDGIPDHWVTWQLSLPDGVPALDLPANADPDGDLITNLREYQLGTRARHLDSDGDGESDWQELAQQTDPGNAASKGTPVEISAYEGTTNLVIPQTLANPVAGAAYDLSMLGAAPAAEPYEIKSSNQVGGPAYEWIEISTTGERLSAFDSNAYAMVSKTLPFGFPFYGTNYNNIYISGCGFLTLTDPGGSNPGFPKNFRTEFPNPAGHRPLIAPYEQFLEPNVLGAIYYQAFSDKVVVQWEQVKQYGFDSRVTLQVVLYPDKTIRCNYKEIPLTSGGTYVSGYLVGIQNAAGDKGLAASWYTTGPQQGLLLHSLDPLTVRFAAPEAVPADWVEASAAAVSGDPLAWNLEFTLTGLTPGLQEAQLILKSQAGTILYTRMVKLTVLPPGGPGDDTMTGSGANDTISGNGGADTISGVGGNDTLNGGAGNDTLAGGVDNDTLNGGGDNDILTGDAGNDTLNGDAGDDTIKGGSGDDILAGGAGKDVYHYALGDGSDRFSDNAGIHQADDLTADYSDLHFGPGITPGMLRSVYEPSGPEHSDNAWMKFEVNHPSGGSVTVTHWNIYSASTGVFTSKRWRFHFADGSVWPGELFWTTPLFTSVFQGFTGGALADSLSGTAGSDSIRGLAGDDTLQGGGGWDYYYYEWGSGDDIIQDTPPSGDISTVYIYGTALHDKLSYHFVAPDHLRIDVSDPSDPSKNGSVLLREWYKTTPYQVKTGWRLFVQNGSGGWTDLSIPLRNMITDGPDTFNLAAIHFSNGQTFSSGGGNDMISGSSYAETINGEDGDDTLYGLNGADTLNGGEGQDLLEGGEGNDALNGGTGADTLRGQNGNDTLSGNAGGDLLQGGAGEDSYLWSPGDGDDLVEDSAAITGTYTPGVTVASLSHLIFGSGVSPTDIAMEATAEDLIIKVKDSGGTVIGSVTIADWYLNWNSVGWRIEFTDSTVWDGRTLVTPGNDHFFGTASGETMAGGEGSDTLEGLAGDDVLTGGPGADTVLGGEGNDTYLWNVGDGADTIDDASVSGPTGRNRLEFGAGIDFEDLRFVFLQGKSLRVDVLGSSNEALGSVIVTGWFSGRSKSWQLAFAGGPVLEGSTMVTPLGDDLVGTDAVDIFNSAGGNDQIFTYKGDDDLTGGEGNDALAGGEGNDIYRWNLGDGDDLIYDQSEIEGWTEADGTNPPAYEVNRVIFGSGILPSQITMRVENNDLVFAVRTTAGAPAGSVTLKDWYLRGGGWGWNSWDGHYSLGFTIEFADSTTVWDTRYLATPGNDHLLGTLGQDQLKGGSGPDRLVGLGGNDLLEGGADEDRLTGGGGVDTYVWRSGDGLDYLDMIGHGETDGRDIILLPDLNYADVAFDHDDSQDYGYRHLSVLSTYGDGGIRADQSSGQGQKVEVHFEDGSVATPSAPAAEEGTFHTLSVALTAGALMGTMEDSDGDGVPNRIEVARGTDPEDELEFPQPDALVEPGGAGAAFETIAEAIDAADGSRGTKEMVWIRLMPGTYTERLDIEGNGYYLEGVAGAAAVQVNLPTAAPAHSVAGKNIVVKNLSFGNGSSSGAWEFRSAAPRDGILFDTCLFLSEFSGSGESEPPVKALTGRTDFDHCTFLFLEGMAVSPQARVVVANSVVQYEKDVTLPDFEDILFSNSIDSWGDLPDWGNWRGVIRLSVTPQGYLQNNSESRGQATHFVQGGPRPDLFGRARDDRRDLGCIEFVDSDGDGLDDGWEIRFLGGLSGGQYGDSDSDDIYNIDEFKFGLDPNVADVAGDIDGDGLTDQWELDNFLHLTWADADEDPDEDGLSNLQEQLSGTNPHSDDSDDDYMPDPWELANGTDPWADDSTLDLDSDGVTNFNEFLAGLKANDTDSDDDSVLDGDEDTDGDGLTSLEEQLAGTSIHRPDSDWDGVLDGWEVTHGYNPLVEEAFDQDSDGDGLNDRMEARLGMNPHLADSDGDGTPDGLDQDDRDSDGFVDLWEVQYFDSLADCVPGEDPDKDTLTNLQEQALGTNPSDPDTDGDIFPDAYEVAKESLDPLVPNLAHEDEDGDGLGVQAEFREGTNPDVADSDNDGANDREETIVGTDPLDDTSVPFNPLNHLGPPIGGEGFALFGGAVENVGQLDNFAIGEREGFAVTGAFGDASGSGSEKWALKFLQHGNAGGTPKLLVNSGFGTVDPFNLKLSPKQIWRVELQHWDHDDASDGFDVHLQPGSGGYSVALGYKPDYDYNAAIAAPSSDFLLCYDWKKTPLFGQYGNSIQTGWQDRRAYLVPLAKRGFSESSSGGDAVGPRYRKVALNGRPIPDSPPEGEAETEVQAEETYVDAYDLSLHHDNSFAHLSVAASDLVIEANASLQETNWSNVRGLRPHEVLTSPFGVSWTSNLCAYVETVETLGEYTTDPISVNVVDQGGRSQRFGTMDRETFFPWPSARMDKKTYLNTLEKSGGDFVLRKKFGEKLTFKPCGAWFLYGTDRTKLGNDARKHVYWRLDEVEDRFGNRIKYNYGGDNISLIPEEIKTIGRPGGEQKIGIVRSADGRRVQSITDPAGKTTTFNYTTSTIAQPGSGVWGAPLVDYSYTKLDSIVFEDGESVGYTYEVVPDLETVDGKVTWHYHCNVSSIRNQRGKIHSFEYGFDRTKKYYSGSFGRPAFARDIGILPAEIQQDALGQLAAIKAAPGPLDSSYHTQYGIPRLIKKVTLPGGAGYSEFLRSQETAVKYGPKFDARCGTRVIDVMGKEVIYAFKNVTGEIVDTDVVPGLFMNISMEWMIYYQTMEITYPGGLKEIFEFDVDSGLNLKSATDIAGKTTTWTFSEPSPEDVGLLRPKLDGRPGFLTAWSDPTKKTNALGEDELYEYGVNRILSKVTDTKTGTVTQYELDNLGRRIGMTVSNGGLLAEEEYEFGNAAFPGFMTRSTKIGSGADPDIVTVYEPDDFGRIQKTIVNPGGLAIETSYTYDANNNKLTATDPNGNATSFTYDDRHRLVTVTNADSSFRTIDYDANGAKLSETDENGHTVLYERDDLGRVTSVSKGSGEIVVSNFYNAVGLVTETVDARGVSTFTTYDNLYRPVQVERSGVIIEAMGYADAGGGIVSAAKPTTITTPGNTTTIAYDDLYRPTSTSVNYGSGTAVTTIAYNGLITTTTDPLGKVTQATADGLGRPVLVVRGSKTSSTVYSSTGQPVLTVDPLGRETRTEYDAAGRAIKVWGADPSSGLAGGAGSPMTETVYDDAGNVISVIDPLDRTTDYEYDVRNRKILTEAPLVSSLDPAGNGRPTTITEYDDVGNVVSVTDPSGTITDTIYDFANRPIETTVDAAGLALTTISVFDPGGLVTKVTDANGKETTNTYDDFGRLLTTTTNPGTGGTITVTNEYDTAGNLVSVTDGEGQETEFTYDGLGRKTSTIWDPGTAAERVETSTYDALNITGRTDASGRTTSFTYDDHHRVEEVHFGGTTGASAQDLLYTYDDGDRVLSVTHPNAPDTLRDSAFTYDALNRHLSETSAGVTHTYPSYDLAGNRLQTVFGGTGTTLTSTYDALNRLVTCTQGTRVTSYGYDMGGRVTKKILPNGNTTTTVFDAVGRTTSITEPNSTFVYTYDEVGNVLTCTETYTAPGMVDRTVTNTYDDCYRLLTETITPAGGSATATAYGYDKANNRTSKTAGGVTTIYVFGDGTNGANSNQLMSYGPSGLPATHSFTYDANGNRATSTTSAGTDTLEWDHSNRLVSLTTAGGDTYEYGYDHLTRRVIRDESTAGGVKTLLSFIGGTSVQERDASNVLQAEFIRGSDWGGGVGGLLYSIRGGQYSYNAYNSRGDVVSTSDGTGAATWQASYEAFGTRTLEQGNNGERQRANTKDEDPTGLLNEGFRYRDLEAGVFISRDPAGFVDGPNVYTYVTQNPWSHFDPEGLFFSEWMQSLGERHGSNPVVDWMAPRATVVVNTTQGALTVASAVPALGKVADGLSATISAAEGNYAEAGVTLTAGKATTIVVKGAKAVGVGVKVLSEAAEQSAKHGDEVATVVEQAARHSGEVAEQAAKQSSEIAGKTARETSGEAGNLAETLSSGGQGLEFSYKQAEQLTPQVLQNKAVGDAARDAIAAARPGSVIEQNFRVTGGLRRTDVLDATKAIESKVGRTSLGARERQELARDIKMLRSGQVDSVEWHFSPSPTTGKVGPTAPLREKLEKFGIPIVE